MRKVAALLLLLVAATCVTSRWLPTRENSDRLDKLREMLREILESEYERPMYQKSPVFKRDVGHASGPPAQSGNDVISKIVAEESQQ